MKSFETDLQKYAEKVRLKAAERRELRERVLSYMEYHPLPKRAEQIPAGSIPSQYFIQVPFNSLWVRVVAGAFATLLFVVVPFAAERSVPGDVLYVVKTGVNEGIQSQFADSPYEKVVFETKLMERRISEARLLASEGKLTEEVSAEIAETVKVHADAAQSGIAELRTNNAEEAAIAQITFGSALEVQSAVLDTNSSESATSSVAGIIDVVNTAREQVAENQDPTAPSYDGLSARIESETTRAYELLEVVKKSATPEEQEDISRRLDDIDRLITGAGVVRTEDEAGAVAELVNALGLIQKLVAFMADIDVHETVALETLVPMIPTPEERTTTLEATLLRLSGVRTLVRERLPFVDDVAVLEKVELGLGELDTLLSAATTSLTAGELDGAESAVRDAEAFAADLEAMTRDAAPESILPGDVPTQDNSETGTTTEPIIDSNAEGVEPIPGDVLDTTPLPQNPTEL